MWISGPVAPLHSYFQIVHSYFQIVQSNVRALFNYVFLTSLKFLINLPYSSHAITALVLIGSNNTSRHINKKLQRSQKNVIEKSLDIWLHYLAFWMSYMEKWMHYLDFWFTYLEIWIIYLDIWLGKAIFNISCKIIFSFGSYILHF